MPEVPASKPRNSDSSFGVEQAAVLVIPMSYYGTLPDGFAEEISKRAYDFAAAKGVFMRESKGMVLPIREMK